MAPDLIEAMTRGQRAGGLPGIGLNVDDCQKTFEELTAKGVEFPQPPSARPYGVEAVCRDNSGNWLVLVENTGAVAGDAEVTAHGATN
jgi:predicted enzyme related to lactoylglutathione lyase